MLSRRHYSGIYTTYKTQASHRDDEYPRKCWPILLLAGISDDGDCFRGPVKEPLPWPSLSVVFLPIVS